MTESGIRVSVAAIAEHAGAFLMVEEAIEAGRRFPLAVIADLAGLP